MAVPQLPSYGSGQDGGAGGMPTNLTNLDSITLAQLRNMAPGVNQKPKARPTHALRATLSDVY